MFTGYYAKGFFHEDLQEQSAMLQGEYEDEQLRENPPDKPDFSKCVPSIGLWILSTCSVATQQARTRRQTLIDRNSTTSGVKSVFCIREGASSLCTQDKLVD